MFSTSYSAAFVVVFIPSLSTISSACDSDKTGGCAVIVEWHCEDLGQAESKPLCCGSLDDALGVVGEIHQCDGIFVSISLNSTTLVLHNGTNIHNQRLEQFWLEGLERLYGTTMTQEVDSFSKEATSM